MKKSLPCIALLLFVVCLAGCTYEKHMIPDGKGGYIVEKRRKGSKEVEYKREGPASIEIDD